MSFASGSKGEDSVPAVQYLAQQYPQALTHKNNVDGFAILGLESVANTNARKRKRENVKMDVDK